MVAEEKSAYLDLYLEEASGLLKIFAESVNKLKNNPLDRDTLEVAGRAMHTFASNSGFMGFGKISRIARNMEYFFDFLKKKNSPPTPEMLAAMQKYHGIIKTWFDGVKQNEAEPEIEAYITEMENLKK